MRRRYQAFGRGTMEFLPSDNTKVLTFLRRYKDEIILVAVNLSRFAQAVELDLTRVCGQHAARGVQPECVPEGARRRVVHAYRRCRTGISGSFWSTSQKLGEDIGQPEREAPLLDRLVDLRRSAFRSRSAAGCKIRSCPSTCRFAAGIARRRVRSSAWKSGAPFP